VTLSRRDFVQGASVALTGLVITFHVPRVVRAAPGGPAAKGPPTPNSFVRIAPDDTVTVVLAHSEMGQGMWTGLSMLIAEELECDWSKVRPEHAPAAAVYGQYPPLVNATRPPGEWQTYDIIWTAPRFDDGGKIAHRARVTVIHNGVLVQNDVELTGQTGWINRVPYKAHPERTPIAFQDHGHPVRYRNVWVRELGNPRHKEFMLADSLLDTFVGNFGQAKRNAVVIRRLPDGLLGLTLAGQELVMHAESPTQFFALTTDVQCEFSEGANHLALSVGDSDHAMQLPRMTP